MFRGSYNAKDLSRISFVSIYIFNLNMIDSVYHLACWTFVLKVTS